MGFLVRSLSPMFAMLIAGVSALSARTASEESAGNCVGPGPVCCSYWGHWEHYNPGDPGPPDCNLL